MPAKPAAFDRTHAHYLDKPCPKCRRVALWWCYTFISCQSALCDYKLEVLPRRDVPKGS